MASSLRPAQTAPRTFGAQKSTEPRVRPPIIVAGGRDRTHDGWIHDCPACKARLAARIASGECALQADAVEPWKGWCLTHDVADSMEHHFRVHPDAYND